MQKLKTLLTDHLSGILLVLMVIQPLLDVLSFFADKLGITPVTTLLRFGMLALVGLLGFLITDKKRLYLILYSVIAIFWGAHMINCFRTGYISPIDDAAHLLRLLSFPVYVLTFISALKGRPELRKRFYLGALIALFEIALFTAIPWLIGQPEYTYHKLYLGVMGWFLIPNAQSCILALSAPLGIFAAYKSGRYPLYLLGLAIPVVLMFVTGSKLTFYSIFILCAAYIFLFVLQLGKKSARYILPLMLLLVMTAAFKGQSPMAVRDSMTNYSQGLYNNAISNSMTTSSTDQTALKAVQENKIVKERASSERQIEKARRAVLPIFSDTGVYGDRTEALNERFGMYNVMEVFGYTSSPGVLLNLRTMRVNYAKLAWQENDTLSHILGLEYSDFLLNGEVYDLENDFPSVFYSSGYLGFALYLLSLAVFVYHVLRAFAGSVQQAVLEEEGPAPLRWLRGFWKGLRGFLTVEVGAVGICCLLALGAAQLSGYVLRRPNVAIYFAAAAACLYNITSSLPGPRRVGKRGD